MDDSLRRSGDHPIEVLTYDPNWVALARLERKKLLQTLELCVGGLWVEHIGSTSVPGLAAKPVIDLLLSVTDTPLPSVAVRALEALGYGYRGENGIPGREFFRTEGVHLHVVGLGSEFAHSHILFRSFLRSHPEAARRYESLKFELASRYRFDRAAYTEAKAPLILELLELAHRWEEGFGPPQALRELFADAPFAWLVAGGWAVDLACGVLTRSHEDIDVVIYRQDQLELQRWCAERGCLLEKIVQGGRILDWPLGERLELPIHQVHIDHPESAAGYIDVLLSEGENETWGYRKAPITLPRHEISRVGTTGLPYLAPHALLLYKLTGSQGVREKDAKDLEQLLAAFLPQERKWLHTQLRQIAPDHAYLERLL